MLKFKRVNIVKASENKGLSYQTLDLIRQTTVKQLVEANREIKKEYIKEFLMKKVSYLLDLMIEEE